jgi:hypothetical protein
LKDRKIRMKSSAETKVLSKDIRKNLDEVIVQSEAGIQRRLDVTVDSLTMLVEGVLLTN